MTVDPLRQVGHQLEGGGSYSIVGVGGDGQENGDRDREDFGFISESVSV